MKNTVLKITLDQGNAIVDESGDANRVKKDADTQRITWKLAGNAYHGSILSFAWKTPRPPAGIFGDPEVTPQGKRLNMSDFYPGASAYGSWKYKLTIDVDGTTYTAVASTSPSVQVTNPTIKNN